MPNTLPVVDLSSPREGDEASLTRIAAGVGAACRDVGFFYAVNHGVDAGLIAEAFAQSRRFFASPSPKSRRWRSRKLAATEATPASCTKRSILAEDPI